MAVETLYSSGNPFNDAMAALQSGAATIKWANFDLGEGNGYSAPALFDAQGRQIEGLGVAQNPDGSVLIGAPGDGKNYIHITTQMTPQGTVAPVQSQNQVNYVSKGNDRTNIFATAAALMGAPFLSEALAGATGLTGANLAGATGATMGGLTAAATGNDVLKGAALGGALGYGGSQLNQALNPSVANGWDMASAANYDAGLNGVGSNVGVSPAEMASNQVGGIYGPDNIDVGGGWNPATGMGDYATAQAANPYSADVPAAVTQGPNLPGATIPGSALTSAAGGSALSSLTSNPLATAALVNSAAGLVNAGINKNAISDALNTQLQAGQQAGTTLKDIYNQQLGFVQPYQQMGMTGLDLLGQNKDYLTHQFDATDLAKGLAPNYNFMLQQGQMANQRAANVGGGAIGGNALQGLNKFTQDYAGNAYQNAFNNYQNQRQNIYNTLAGLAGMGQTANQQAIGAGTAYGQNQTNLATGLAAAQAGATMGQSQNQTNLISNLANNVTLASLLGQKSSVA